MYHKREGRKIVLVGGCFDILHPGHVFFLKEAKKAGDILIVLLESDKKVRELKGLNRPVQTQKDRAKVLSALRYVDRVICLPFIEHEFQYDQLIAKIKPDIIALTRGYPNHYHKRTADLVGAKLKYVTGVVGRYSTTSLLNGR